MDYGYSINSVRSLVINSNDWGISNNSTSITLDVPIVSPVKFKVRKVIMPNAFYQFLPGINDMFYILFQNEPDSPVQIPVPTNQIIYTFDQFALFIQTALNVATSGGDTANMWSVIYDFTINKLVISNNDSASFKVLTREDLTAMAVPFENSLINSNLGVDDTILTSTLPAGGFTSALTLPNNPICNATEVYINADFSSSNVVALPGGLSRRDTILVMPLLKAFSGICVYNSKSDDWIPFTESNTISQFSISLTDRYGRLVNLGLPYTIQIDFAY